MPGDGHKDPAALCAVRSYETPPFFTPPGLVPPPRWGGCGDLPTREALKNSEHPPRRLNPGGFLRQKTESRERDPSHLPTCQNLNTKAPSRRHWTGFGTPAHEPPDFLYSGELSIKFFNPTPVHDPIASPLVKKNTITSPAFSLKLSSTCAGPSIIATVPK